MLRKVLIFEQNFTDARNTLANTVLTAPIYYIISGTQPNEGTVIERKANGVHAIYDLNATQWFLVQTNYDRNEDDPSRDKRRTPAEEKLEKIG